MMDYFNELLGSYAQDDGLQGSVNFNKLLKWLTAQSTLLPPGYPQGGMMGATGMVEKGEVLETPNGNLHKVGGGSHESGDDTQVVAVPGTKVFSDRVKIRGESMADRKLDRDKRKKDRMKMVDGLIKHSEKRGPNAVDEFTLNRSIQNVLADEVVDSMIDKTDMEIQEGLSLLEKVFGQSGPADEFKYGGKMKKKKRPAYPLGGTMKLDPEQEKIYQQWKKSLPGNLGTETDDYDLKEAWLGGVGPQFMPETGEWHLPSRNPQTGQLLKSPNHPTFTEMLDGETAAGYVPSMDVRTGKMKSFPKNYAVGGYFGLDPSVKKTLQQLLMNDPNDFPLDNTQLVPHNQFRTKASLPQTIAGTNRAVYDPAKRRHFNSLDPLPGRDLGEVTMDTAYDPFADYTGRRSGVGANEEFGPGPADRRNPLNFADTPGGGAYKAGLGIGTIGPLITTILNRMGDRDVPNFFAKTGNRALGAQGEAIRATGALADSEVDDIRLGEAGDRAAIREGGGSVNTNRAMNLASRNNANRAIREVMTGSGRQIAGLTSDRAALLHSIEGQAAAGATKQFDDREHQRDQFYTNLAQNLSGIGVGLQQLGNLKAKNATVQNFQAFTESDIFKEILEKSSTGNIDQILAMFGMDGASWPVKKG